VELDSVIGDIAPFIDSAIQIDRLSNRAERLVPEDKRQDMRTRVAAMTEHFNQALALGKQVRRLDQLCASKERLEDIHGAIELVDEALEARGAQIKLLQGAMSIDPAPQQSLPLTAAHEELREAVEMRETQTASARKIAITSYYMLKDPNVEHFTIPEIATFLRKDAKTVRKDYKGRLGVHHDPTQETRNKRAYTPLRVPAAMLRMDYSKSRALA
jgi:ADP-ribose pyrophosphatase YjhB (NUDIX family)